MFQSTRPTKKFSGELLGAHHTDLSDIGIARQGVVWKWIQRQHRRRRGIEIRHLLAAYDPLMHCRARDEYRIVGVEYLLDPLVVRRRRIACSS